MDGLAALSPMLRQTSSFSPVQTKNEDGMLNLSGQVKEQPPVKVAAESFSKVNVSSPLTNPEVKALEPVADHG